MRTLLLFLFTLAAHGAILDSSTVSTGIYADSYLPQATVTDTSIALSITGPFFVEPFRYTKIATGSITDALLALEDGTLSATLSWVMSGGQDLASATAEWRFTLGDQTESGFQRFLNYTQQTGLPQKPDGIIYTGTWTLTKEVKAGDIVRLVAWAQAKINDSMHLANVRGTWTLQISGVPTEGLLFMPEPGTYVVGFALALIALRKAKALL
jgi:hypothetical protein